MLDNNTDVSALLERVISQAPTPVQSSRPQPSALGVGNANLLLDDDQQWWLPGICGRTRVTTNFGQVPAQLLRVGDRVLVRSGRYLAIKKISVTKLDCQFIEQRPDARPVLIPRGCLDQNLPSQDVLLSPAQTVTFFATHTASKVIRAKDLARSSQAVDKTLGMIAYYEVHLTAEDDVCCEGVWVKSAGVK